MSLQRYLQISVSDKGEGVAEDQLDRIMQPFERGETARTTQGSGLGLAIVSRIAHLHNGIVIAHNQENTGACGNGDDTFSGIIFVKKRLFFLYQSSVATHW